MKQLKLKENNQVTRVSVYTETCSSIEKPDICERRKFNLAPGRHGGNILVLIIDRKKRGKRKKDIKKKRQKEIKREGKGNN